MSEMTEIAAEKEKVTLDLSEFEKELEIPTFKFKKQTITVFPYLKVGDKSTLIAEYLSALYSDPSTDLEIRYLIAEYAVMMRLIDTVTNIDIDNLDPDVVVHSGLYKEITSRIANYSEFRYELEEVCKIRQEEIAIKNSIGAVLQNLVDKLNKTLENASQMDAESIRQAGKEFTDNLKQLNENVPGILTAPKLIESEPKAKRTRAKKVN